MLRYCSQALQKSSANADQIIAIVEVLEGLVKQDLGGMLAEQTTASRFVHDQHDDS